MYNKTLLVTGSSGFVGSAFLNDEKSSFSKVRTETVRNENLNQLSLDGVDIVLHLAGKAHQMQYVDNQLYFDINFKLTKELAITAKNSGVSHFIFVSTIKVYGEHDEGPYSEVSATIPGQDPYGLSKLQAENFLKSIEDEKFIVSIIRPPLVYGPEVKGNMISLLQLCNTSLPLPFADIQNKRTMVYVRNLTSLIMKVIETKKSGIFLAGDREPISTTTLIEQIRKQLGKPARLFKLPIFILYLLQIVKPSLHKRLFCSLQVNTTSTQNRLDFIPPFSTEYGIQQMVNWYVNFNRK